MAHVAYRAPPRPPWLVLSRTVAFAAALALPGCGDAPSALAPPDGPEPSLAAPSFTAEAVERIPAVLGSLEDLRTWFLPESSREFTVRVTPLVRAVERALEAADPWGLQTGLAALTSELADMDPSSLGPEGPVATDAVKITAGAAGQLLAEPVPLFETLESPGATVYAAPGNDGGTSP